MKFPLVHSKGFPKTIRARLIAATAGVTLLISIITLTTCFFVFQSFLRKNQIQSSEFNLQLVANSIAADMDDITYFSKWTSSNSEILHYLERMNQISSLPAEGQDNGSLRAMAIETFERFKEEYYNTAPSDYITHALVSTNNRKNYLHLLGASEPSMAHAADVVYRAPWFKELYNSRDFLWIGLVDDPFTRVRPSKVVPMVRPVYNDTSSTIIGWSYISVSQAIFTDYLNAFPLAEDSMLFVTIGETVYQLVDGEFLKADKAFTPGEAQTGDSLNENTLVQSVTLKSGAERTMITLPLGDVGWSISQVLSEEQFAQQRNFYYMLIAGVCLTIILLGLLLMALLNRLIHQPVQKIREKISAVAQGDFSRDPSIEWDHELGDIGKGINNLSTDILQLMDKRIEDEKQKKDLEYQILQSQINPHFLYNTLNSIKWMATIQGAGGIAEMTTALARLMKNVSKGTAALIPLKEELDLVHDYFLIQQYRYGGSIALDCSVESEELYACRIHRFTLQPIVENALFHGIEPKGQAGKISIRAEEGELSGARTLRISITDNGIGMSPETIEKVLTSTEAPSTDFFRHVGISNVNRRIQYAFGDRYGISITSEVGRYTTMTITIPYRTGEEAPDNGRIAP